MKITHPFHPLRGKEVRFARIRKGIKPDLVICFPDGHYGAIPLDWTDFALADGARARNLSSEGEKHLLCLEGLAKVVALVSSLKEEKSDQSKPSKSKPKNNEGEHA